MKVSADVICKSCKKVFCCPECRHKHEIKNHAIIVRNPTSIASANDSLSGDKNATELIYLFCPICQKKPLLLKVDMYNEMLDHIGENHLPLNCEKCSKVYTKIEDLKEVTKCIQPQEDCLASNLVSIEEEFPEDVPTLNRKAIHTTIATQTSPMRPHNDFNDTNITPISMINLRWKAKSKIMHEEFISDSVSSIKNISSFSNSSTRRSIGVASSNNGKLVRSTSTPLQAEMIFAKPREQAFNASAGHVSSIYNSGSESESSMPVSNTVGTPSKQALDVNRYRKVGGRPKMFTVTPLRHVMSKSIQKAFAEHGPPEAVHNGGHNRKKIFESTHNSSMMASSPLDLRLSPAMRRTNSEPSQNSSSDVLDAYVGGVTATKMEHEVLLSSKKTTTTESIVITRLQKLTCVESLSSNASLSTNNSSLTNQTDSVASSTDRSSLGTSSVYQTCHSVTEIVTSTELCAALNVPQSTSDSEPTSITDLLPVALVHSSALYEDLTNMADITPIARIRGAVIKKNLIVFETPIYESLEPLKKQRNSPTDAYYTPDATPVRKSYLQRESSDDSDRVKSGERQKLAVSRRLNGRFSPSRRPSLRECAQSTIFSHIEDISDNYDNDEVFEEAQKSTKENKKPAETASGGLWSLMTSVMRLPSLKGDQAGKNRDCKTGKTSSSSILKRCASIAGSIVRSKPLVDEAQLQSLKRKRTYTYTDDQFTFLSTSNYTDASSICDSSSASSKRFRIQGRKPIERMRQNS